jgi:hypothetical protein
VGGHRWFAASFGLDFRLAPFRSHLAVDTLRSSYIPQLAFGYERTSTSTLMILHGTRNEAQHALGFVIVSLIRFALFACPKPATGPANGGTWSKSEAVSAMQIADLCGAFVAAVYYQRVQ